MEDVASVSGILVMALFVLMIVLVVLSCIPLPLPKGEHSIHALALGLGIDLQTKDYKVVRILEILDCFCFPVVYESCEVEVYSLSSNSWRQIGGDTPLLDEFRILFSLASSYWNGAYYWCAASKGSTTMDGICSFNFTDEEFQFMSVPKEDIFLRVGQVWWCGIIEFNNGALALITHHGLAEIGSCLDVWAVGTWTKLLSTTKPLLMDFQMNTPLTLLNKDQLIFTLNNGQPASFSFVTNQHKILPINSRESTRSRYGAVIYKTSLVQI